ncbi:MAG: HDOD domain-containing protein [Planctomycetaceae bacterium]|nr:HDOD domain-containing protein [Planctomycetaceae bacterium]
MSAAQATEGIDSLNWARLRAEALESIKTVNLPDDIQIPALPQAVTEFAERAADPDAEIRDLALIVETSTGLTLELLKYANSSLFGGVRPIHSVAGAIARIGINGAKTYLVAVGMKAASKAMESRLMNQRIAWNESLQKALFARATARRLKMDEGLAFMGGLLQDFLLLALTNRFDREYVRFLETDAREGRDLAEWEQQRFGWNHASAGALVAHQWHFPDDLLCAIYYHHSLRDTLTNPDMEFFRLFPITLSGLLPDQLRQSSRGMAELISVDGRCRAMNLDELCMEVDAEQQQMADGMEIPQQLTGLLQEARRVFSS